MKNYIIISISIVLLVTTIIIFKTRNNKEIQGLGKSKSNGRPPKLRILYSRKQSAKDREKVSSSNDAYLILQKIWSKQIETREEMIILLLNRSNQILGYHVLSMGGITGTVADLRLIFAVALESLATSFILSHNHPSGNINPSESDIKLTEKVKEAGKIMDITILDHLILTKEHYYSFADEGIL